MFSSIKRKLILILFLGDDLSRNQSGEEVAVTGQNSILPKEMGNKFYNLQIIHHLDKDVCAVASWDSSIHDSIHLNKVTDGKSYSSPPKFFQKITIR